MTDTDRHSDECNKANDRSAIEVCICGKLAAYRAARRENETEV
jgi:hypothetical protein